MYLQATALVFLLNGIWQEAETLDTKSINCSVTAQTLPYDAIKMTFNCPLSCSDEMNDVDNAPQITAENIGGFFTEESSICLAAEQAELLTTSRNVSIILVPTTPAFNQSMPDTSSRTFLLQNIVCYVDKGQNYMGYTETTTKGGECSENACANRGGSRDRPWCDVYGGEWEYCDIAPSCDDIHVVSLDGTSAIDSTSFPGTEFNPNQHKIWIITARAGFKIEFAIQAASFDVSDNCNLTRDQIVLYHNFGNITNVIQICDPSYHQSVTSSRNLLYVEFRANDVNKQFKAEIREVLDSLDCDVDFHNVTSGNFSTPNFPERYPNLATCSWRIRVKNSSIVRIIIHEFTLQESSAENCIDGDYAVIIEEGDALVELCGELQRQVITSSTNDVTVRFSSDSSGQYRGFFATFQEIERRDCDFEFFGEEGNFETPGYPDSFAHVAEHYMESVETVTSCYWRISFEPGFNISITFSNVTCENSTRISIYDGQSTNSRKILTLCNSDVIDMTSSGDGENGSDHDPTHITSSGEHVLVELMTSSLSSDDVSFRFHTLANRIKFPEQTTDGTSTTTETYSTGGSMTTSDEKTNRPITIAQTTEVIDDVTMKYISSTQSTDGLKTIVTTVFRMTDQNRQSIDTTTLVVSVLGVVFGIALIIVTVVLVRNMLASRKRYSTQAHEEVSRTDEYEMASLQTLDSA